MIEIIEFKIKRVANGFTIDVEYRDVSDRISLREYKTLIAANLDEVNALLKEWFDKEVAK